MNQEQSPATPTDPMQVSLGHLREVEVYHHVYGLEKVNDFIATKATNDNIKKN